MRNWLKVAIILLLISSCGENIDPVSPANDAAYYPTEIGLYRTYLVSEIDYQISGFDTANYYLRETLVDSFSTGGQLTYLLQREIAVDSTFDWEADSLWLLRIEVGRIILVQNNIPAVLLSLPVKEDSRWDRNAFNTRPANDQYYAQASPEELLTDGSIVSGTELIKVIISDIPQNIVNQNEQWEVYGKEIGLIEKKSIILDFCTVDCDSSGQIESGRFLSQHLIDYGRN